MDEKINRRDFVKGAGLASAATVATLMATASTVSAEELVNPGGKAMDEMGNASIKRDLPESFYKRIENKAGYIGTTRVVAPTQRLDAREHGFSQIVRRGSTGDWSGESGDWGPILLAAVQEKKKHAAEISPLEAADYTWSNAFQIAMDRWHITLEPGRYQQAPIAATKVELSPEEMTARIKKICRWFGCEQVGICEVTEDMKPFFYSVGRTRGTYTTGHANYVDNGREIPWPYPYKYCIVMADKCDTDTLNALTGPLVEASAKIACSQSDFAPHYLESIIRSLGHDAKANIFSDTDIMDTPFAVKAGLGELGRSGLVISPWGAQMRIMEVFTNLPLVPDKPIDFGLQEFCKVCKKCADNCPASAISMDDEPSEVDTVVKSIRWFQDGKKCLAQRLAYGCSKCQGVCPWSKPDTLIHEVGRMVGQNPAFAPFLVKLDDFFYNRYPEGHATGEWAPWR
ncbi:reductive dehalogenase [Dehalococcoides mccartyi]|jgi:reductive dehalogenase|uniref:Reductive dehalogenase n=4 Tax=Bacteria TaxID=2 RepID=A0A142V8P0_9CHLR|nr:reductive dehalogenase [Dehalococcoides mccartyi]UZH91492.1 reductive dehalogenase [uncultured bacterium]AII60380.1 dehalogenase [Dehalococcoides mccartyi CG5]AMU86019.1 reductive dehalogenase [Dehalococcoides mccartyi]AOV98827.1 reductive dehalogenase [Dehalococcoides mccartyi]MBA2084586.1 Tetrachloroethene reductive dehalogenase PceA [Dehalococcoides mccartyi]